jgi:hypothetical protein
MTSQKLYETLQLMVSVDAELSLQATLNQIRENLSNLAGQPAATQYQSALASALNSFSTGAAQLQNEITPAQFSAIAELGGAEFFDPAMFEKVKTAIERNAMTPSVARDFAQDLATRRSQFLDTVKATLDGLRKLISAEPSRPDVAPGEAAFSIPRDLFDNRLRQFAKELNFISILMDHISEASTGEVQPIELEYLSSSNPVVAVGAGLGLLKLLGIVVNSFLDAWKKVEEIRELRGRLKRVGVSGLATDELTETITTTVEEVVEESTKLVLSAYTKDGARKNELENALKMDLHRLFGQIERGLTVEIKTNKADDQAETEDAKAIGGLAKSMVYPIVTREPMLLATSEILEGEVSKKKVSTKRTNTQKTSIKSGAHAVEKGD